MKRRNRVIILASLILVSSLFIFTTLINANTESERKIVIFKQNIDNTKKTDILTKYGVEKIKDLTEINAVVAKVSKKNKLYKAQDIAYIENDSIVSISAKKDKKPKPDPEPVSVPETIPWRIEFVCAPELWLTTTGDNVKVGILDTGIDLDHPDLSVNIKGGFNALKKNKPPQDDNGHGTHVAGIIAAVDNEIGVIGVLPDADLYAVKVLDSNGNGYLSDLIEGIDWCIKNDIEILNMSLGMIEYSQALHEIISQANQSGITMIAAAGNNFGGASEYPAAYPEVISVGALNKDGSIAVFSAVENVDVYMPGADIFSTIYDDTYAEKSGTSMACPHYIRILKNKN